MASRAGMVESKLEPRAKPSPDDHGTCPHCGIGLNGPRIWQSFYERYGRDKPINGLRTTALPRNVVVSAESSPKHARLLACQLSIDAPTACQI